MAEHDFVAVAGVSPLHREILLRGPTMPDACRPCRERETCGGGYLPHRYARQSGFANPTVWCEDLLVLFGRMRELLGVDATETSLRRRVLEEMVTNG